MRVSVRRSLIVAGLVVAGLLVWQAMRERAPSQKKAAAAQTVKTAVARLQTVPVTVSANGYVTAINTVDVRPQIQNVVRTIHVKEGQNVRAGDLLFTLDDRGDASGVAKAQAQLASNRADLEDAEASLKRNLDLLAKHFVSQAVVDTARTRVDTLRSTAAAGSAAVQASHVALGYNQIRASISGRLGAISVYPGSLAQPTGAAMVTIAQLDPIAISFSVPERELSYIVASYPDGAAPVVAIKADQSQLQGKLMFIDNTSDTQNGTIRMKARFDNAGRNLWPGTYVNVSLVARTLENAIVVPAQAIVTGPTDKFVYVVQPDNLVAAQKIEVTAIERGQAAITGVPVGTKVVVEGAQNLRHGVLVKEEQAAVKAPV